MPEYIGRRVLPAQQRTTDGDADNGDDDGEQEENSGHGDDAGVVFEDHGRLDASLLDHHVRLRAQLNPCTTSANTQREI